MKLVGTFSLLALLGCGEIVPADQSAAAPPVVEPTDAGVDAPAPEAKRIVEQRNPFGLLDPTNLMLDGDFEFTGRQGQMPWLSFTDESVLNYETGGLCLSGVRCAKLERRGALFGWMAVPKDRTALTIRVMARYFPAPGGEAGCPKGKINVYLIDVDSGQGVDTVRFRDTIEPERGFCTYESTVTPSLAFRSPGVFVEASDEFERNEIVLIDRVQATAGSQQPQPTPPLRELPSKASPPNAQAQARIQKAAAWIRAHRIPSAPSRKLEPVK